MARLESEVSTVRSRKFRVVVVGQKPCITKSNQAIHGRGKALINWITGYSARSLEIVAYQCIKAIYDQFRAGTSL